jgi:hypothetical protein
MSLLDLLVILVAAIVYVFGKIPFAFPLYFIIVVLALILVRLARGERL